MLNRIWNDESGVLTFEWILLITVLVIGIVGALSAVRDALNTELADVAGAIVALDQSYFICWPWEVTTPESADDVVWDGGSASMFVDSNYLKEARVGGNTAGEATEDDQTSYKWAQTSQWRTVNGELESLSVLVTTPSTAND